MPKHTYMATILTVAFIAFAPCVSFQAHAQDEEAGFLEQALKLSAEQEKLWGPVEEVLTNLREQRRALRSAPTAGEPADQIERLRRRAELTTQRAEALKKLADAVQPLWATLSDEQKRELTRSFAMAPSRNDQRQQSYGRDDDHRRHRGAWRYDDRDRADRDLRDRDDGEWRRNRDRMMGRRGGDELDDRDDMRRDRFDRYSRRQSQQDDYRPRAPEFDRDRRDFDRRSDRDYCRCHRYD
jgi:hypothetical protein